VVLDDRIVRKQYGALFTSSFPRRMQILKSIDAISRFLEDGRKHDVKNN
jgi:hypothetical protein